MVESTTTPLLTVIIVNYNGGRYLTDCLSSLSERLTVPFEVILVDNASTNDDCAEVEGVYPWLSIIRNQSNVGFAAGNNIGARAARGKFLLLLNNDTELLSDVRPGIALLEGEDSTVGAVGARMVGRDGEYRYSAGRFPRAWRLFRWKTLYKRSGPFRNGDFTSEGNAGIAVDWVEGSFILTPRSLWERLSGLDAQYFMYVEDVDYCRSIANVGLEVVYLPSMSYRHYGGYGESRLPLLVDGFLRFHSKFSGRLEQAVASGILRLGLCVRLLVAIGLRPNGWEQRVVACWTALRECRWRTS